MTHEPTDRPAASVEERAVIQIRAPHFHAGIVVESGHIVQTAPILGWARGWGVGRFQAWCIAKGYGMEMVS